MLPGIAWSRLLILLACNVLVSFSIKIALASRQEGKSLPLLLLWWSLCQTHWDMTISVLRMSNYGFNLSDTESDRHTFLSLTYASLERLHFFNVAYFTCILNLIGINMLVIYNYYYFNIYRTCNDVSFIIADIGKLYFFYFFLKDAINFIFANKIAFWLC